MERPLRLIQANPLDSLARTIEALLVVASQPLTVDALAEACADEVERVETALGLLGDRYREGRSGIVLEQVAGGWAFRASREAAEACGRLFERPVERNLSQASLETLAVVAYMGPCSRPEIARWRGVAVDSVVAGLVERGLIAEAGRGDLGAVRYRVTPLFERVFGLESLAALPRLDEFGGDAEELRDTRVAGRAPSGLTSRVLPILLEAAPRGEHRPLGSNHRREPVQAERAVGDVDERALDSASSRVRLVPEGRATAVAQVVRPPGLVRERVAQASRDSKSRQYWRMPKYGDRFRGRRPPRAGGGRPGVPRPKPSSRARDARPSRLPAAPRRACRGT